MMRPSAILMCVFAALTWCTQTRAQQASPELLIAADGDIRIDGDGNVLDCELRGKLSPTMRALVSKKVRGWHFAPIVVDGKPVIARTAIHLNLRARPRSEASDADYAVSVTQVSFGQPKTASQKPPRYPALAVQYRIGARVMMSLRLDDHGNVVEAAPYQTNLDARPASEEHALFWRNIFEKARPEAVKRWHFDPTEILDGQVQSTNAIIPIVFSLDHASDKWKPYLAGPVHPAPWTRVAAPASTVVGTDLQQGEALSLDSHFHLKDDVIGKTL